MVGHQWKKDTLYSKIVWKVSTLERLLLLTVVKKTLYIMCFQIYCFCRFISKNTGKLTFSIKIFIDPWTGGLNPSSLEHNPAFFWRQWTFYFNSKSSFLWNLSLFIVFPPFPPTSWISTQHVFIDLLAQLSDFGQPPLNT